MSLKCYTESDLNLICKAEDFRRLSNIASSILLRMLQPVVMVSGPISSGGLGSRDKNIEAFSTVIENLERLSISVFDQMPFEPRMLEIMEENQNIDGLHLLEEFYLPIFYSGLIKKIYFIKDWKSSFGATWEHIQAKRLRIEVDYQ